MGRGTINVNRCFTPVAGYPLIAEVRKEPDQTKNICGGWHTDHSYDDAPVMGSLLYTIEVPSKGGDTLFASMYDAYDTLPEDMKREVDKLEAWHSSRHVFGYATQDGESRVDGRIGNPESAVQDVLHPVVIRHPDSGRKALYVNPEFTVRFEGRTEEDSRPLLDDLYVHAVRPEHTCRFRWRKGSMALWDNRATWHDAVNDYHGQRRIMHRITVEGVPLSSDGRRPAPAPAGRSARPPACWGMVGESGSKAVERLQDDAGFPQHPIDPGGDGRSVDRRVVPPRVGQPGDVAKVHAVGRDGPQVLPWNRACHRRSPARAQRPGSDGRRVRRVAQPVHEDAPGPPGLAKLHGHELAVHRCRQFRCAPCQAGHRIGPGRAIEPAPEVVAVRPGCHTKGEVVGCYRSVAGRMFPFIANRALTVERLPSGSHRHYGVSTPLTCRRSLEMRQPSREGMEIWDAPCLNRLFGNEWGVGDLPGGVGIHQK